MHIAQAKNLVIYFLFDYAYDWFIVWLHSLSL